MEKKIKFEDIIAFIKKAMEKNYIIQISYYKDTGISSTVYITKELPDNKFKSQNFTWKTVENKLYIYLDFNRYCEKFSDYTLEIEDRKDILKWQTLIEEVIDYTHNKLEEDFENFFKEEPYVLKDINDLDDKDD